MANNSPGHEGRAENGPGSDIRWDQQQNAGHQLQSADNNLAFGLHTELRKKLDGFRMAAEFKVQGLAHYDNCDELGDPLEGNVEFGVHFLMAIRFGVGVGQAG